MNPDPAGGAAAPPLTLRKVRDDDSHFSFVAPVLEWGRRWLATVNSVGAL